MTRFGKLCGHIRVEAGETQKTMAKRLGISHNTLSRAEKGRLKPNIIWLRTIAELYQLTEDQKAEMSDLLKEQMSGSNRLNIKDLTEEEQDLAFRFVRYIQKIDRAAAEQLIRTAAQSDVSAVTP